MVGAVAVSVLTAVGMGWLLRGGADEAPVEGDALVLCYPPAFRVLGALVALTGVGMVAVLTWTLDLDPARDGWATLTVVLMFGVPGLAVVAVARRERVVVSREGLRRVGVSGRSRWLGWRDVERVTFGPTRGALTFHGADGARLHVSAYLVGVVGLADVVERRLADRGGAEAVGHLRAFRQSGVGVPKR